MTSESRSKQWSAQALDGKDGNISVLTAIALESRDHTLPLQHPSLCVLNRQVSRLMCKRERERETSFITLSKYLNGQPKVGNQVPLPVSSPSPSLSVQQEVFDLATSPLLTSLTQLIQTLNCSYMDKEQGGRTRVNGWVGMGGEVKAKKKIACHLRYILPLRELQDRFTFSIYKCYSFISFSCLLYIHFLLSICYMHSSIFQDQSMISASKIQYLAMPQLESNVHNFFYFFHLSYRIPIILHKHSTLSNLGPALKKTRH